MPDLGAQELERLYDAHAQSLYAFLLNLTRNEADTRDLMQEVFVKLACRPELLDGVLRARSFLLRLAHNAAVDLQRRRATRQAGHERCSAELDPVFDAADTVDEPLFRHRLNEALAELPPDQRAVAHLKLWEGLTFEEVAALLDISINTAGSRYRYALDKLRRRLRPLYDELKLES